MGGADVDLSSCLIGIITGWADVLILVCVVIQALGRPLWTVKEDVDINNIPTGCYSRSPFLRAGNHYWTGG